MTDMSPWSKNFLSKANPKSVASCILSGIWLDYIWETYLCFRQFSLTRSAKEMPRNIAEITTPEIYTLSRLYHMDQMKLGFAKDLFALTVSTAIIRHGILAKVWALSERITPFRGEIGTTWMWSVIFTTGSTFIYLPFTLYETFVLENKYGFNNIPFEIFLTDIIITLIFLHILNLPAYAVFISLVKLSGDKVGLVLWLLSTLALLGLTATFPTLIDPMDGSFTPLPEGKLKDDIEQLARTVGFPLGGIYIKDSSQRTSHANAYFAGMFGSKRIVLYDTLLTICTPNEILAILCHEFGHWKHKHIAARIVAFQIYLILTISMYSWTYRWPTLYQAMGFPIGVEPVLIGLMVLTSLVMVPINSIATCLLNTLSRHQEYQADQFAVQFGKANDLIGALKQLHKGNLADLVYDPLYVSWYHSHPPIAERIEALRQK
ncbi:CAAX prenyl protease 1 homolog [Agrilus planipennis]|uniref:CAAX prenyl protease n=1 Tax=Agrilus planipennis TaxID=224129 RepID=A0A1W4WGI5_AGRPL|nr:CAAX prenyl protease 1 homolog [Agrilus planipennis]